MRVLYPGVAEGELLRLEAPLSFWGGVDPASGTIIAAQHPQRGVSIAGKILALPEAIGSSSSSSVMLELIRARKAPAAVIMGAVDAILIVGCLVGRELGYACPPAVEMTAEEIAGLAEGRYALETQGLRLTLGA
ncbi:aconitase X swivel domain-containing protein [Lacibacterium aquatile]|uniref:Aconitase X swivel domain-containing protein n=1 Tax=Lacibacterium aquatile TaxID=1168082 RepID=A0ABW5DVU7_9PROT